MSVRDGRSPVSLQHKGREGVPYPAHAPGASFPGATLNLSCMPCDHFSEENMVFQGN